jgi:hypothetical protein
VFKSRLLTAFAVSGACISLALIHRAAVESAPDSAIQAMGLIADPRSAEPLAEVFSAIADGSAAKPVSIAAGEAPAADPSAPTEPLDCATVEGRIEQLELSTEEAELARAFGQDELSQKIRRAVLAWRYSGALGDTSRLHEEYLESFRESPREVALVVERALGSMPRREFADERAKLISLLAEVGDESATRNIASVEMVSGSAKEGLVAAAAAAFYKTDPEEGVALGRTLEGIAKQNDPYIQADLAAQFSSKYPALEADLKRELGVRGIEL